VADELERLVAFARALHDEGLAAGPGRVVEFCRAAAELPPEDLYWAGRLTLVARPEEIPVYDRVFRGVLEEEPPPVRGVTIVEEEVALASREELLRTKSFADLTREELVELAELMRRLRLNVPSRRTRRRGAAIPICAGHCDGPSAPAASPSSARGGSGAGDAGGSCCYSTSPARWRTTRARWSCSRVPRYRRTRAGRRFASARG
jgi:hypothetical protein